MMHHLNVNPLHPPIQKELPNYQPNTLQEQVGSRSGGVTMNHYESRTDT